MSYKPRKSITLIIVFIILFTILFLFAREAAKHLYRDPEVLLNRYYLLRNSNPQAAQNALIILLQQDQYHQKALKELSEIYLQKKELTKALPLLIKLQQLNPQDLAYPMQLALLYYKKGDWDQTQALLKELKKTPSLSYKLQAQMLLNQMDSYLPYYYDNASIAPLKKEAIIQGYPIINDHNPVSSKLGKQRSISPENLALESFYLLKKYHPTAAWKLIKNIVTLYPKNILALKEAGFLAIDLHHRNEAIRYFSKAYKLTYEPALAMQLGYLYDEPGGINTRSTDKYWAFHYFNLATHTNDKLLELNAQNAMTNLSGLQTKVLPMPYFGEVFLDPFSQSRFGLTVRPFIARLGIEHDNRWQSKTYFVFRRTQDNRSINAGQISQIYEDNVQVLGVGEQITPIASLPLIGFVEAGRAYDLVYRQRKPWRNDVRAGLVYYNEFGARPAYFEHPTANANYYSTLYGDFTYFSRYHNNFIATAKTHQGIRLWQYHSIMLNVYVSGRVIEDTNRDFFNNIAEVGPGIGFIPSNRYKVEIRFEHINGAYLPVGNSINPYGKYYTNNLVQLFFYTKL